MLERRPDNPGMLVELKERWEDTSAAQKIGLGAAVCLMAALLVAYALSTREDKDWRPLFTQLDPSKANQVIEKLEEMGQPFKLGGDGSLILVPSSSVGRIRLELAGAGLLNEEIAGFELFESASLGRSDFSERVTYLRALQGELSSTIKSIENVKKARVHITLNQQNVFLDQQTEASAAIYVEMEPGAKLNDNQIRGIIALVTNSVEGINPDQVTLFDAAGTLQVSGADLEKESLQGGDAADRSAYLTKIAQSIVDRILGPGKGIASVQVELDQKTQRIEKESHEPGGDGDGVPTRRQVTKELFEGTEPAANREPGAIPVNVTAQQAGQKPKYSQEASTVDFVVNKTVEVVDQAPGSIRKLHASVVVDASAGLTADQLEALSDGVKAAIGLDPEREDQFELTALPFNREHLELASQQAAEAEKAKEDDKKFLLYLFAGIGGTTVLGLAIAFFLRRRNKRKEVWMDVNIDQMITDETTTNAELEEQINFLLPPEPDPVIESPDELLIRALEEVERDPESVARLLELWVQGDQ